MAKPPKGVLLFHRPPGRLYGFIHTLAAKPPTTTLSEATQPFYTTCLRQQAITCRASGAPLRRSRMHAPLSDSKHNPWHQGPEGPMDAICPSAPKAQAPTGIQECAADAPGPERDPNPIPVPIPSPTASSLPAEPASPNSPLPLLRDSL